MDSIPKDPFLEIKPDVLQEIRKHFNLHDPGVMAELINSFQEWISKQNHFIRKEFDKQVLENMVISAKGSLERAKRTLDKLSTAKTLKQDFYKDININKFPDITTFIIPTILPKMTQDNYRVFMVNVTTLDFETKNFIYYLKFIMLVLEYLRRHDYFMGLVTVFDCRNINFISHLMKFDLIEIKNFTSLVLEGYGLRLKGLHFITESKSVETLVGFVKQILPTKLGERVHTHRTVDTVYEHIPKDILPAEYGGQEKSIRSIYSSVKRRKVDDFESFNGVREIPREDVVRSTKGNDKGEWLKLLGSEENLKYLNDICQPGTNESLRSADNYNEYVMGMPGSFRTIRVD